MRFLIGHCDFLTLGTSAMPCSWQLTEPTSFNVMAAFSIKIVGHGWILSGISSKSVNFLRTVPWLQTVDLHQLWAHVLALGSGSKNLWNQAKHAALFTDLSCAMWTEELLFFTRHANSEAHQQKLRAESSDSTLPWVEWCLLIRVIICWTHLLHQRLFTGQLMAVLNSATWWSTTAHLSVLRQSSLVLELCFYRICKHSTFKRLFHNW